jgi:thiol-disulfide isomerase/thioredoxin
MNTLIRLFSFNSYYFLSNAIGLVLTIAVLRDGLSALDVVIVAVYVLGAGLVARRLRTPRKLMARFDGLAAFDQALRDPRPTMLEFYSDNCGVCMAMKPVMDRLEQAVGHRLQILRLNVADPIGLQLADRYGVTLTPTFLLLNGAGLKDEEFTLVLDRARVLYWLDQQTVAPGMG